MSNETEINTHIEINTDVDLNTEIAAIEFTPTEVVEEEEIVLFAIVEEKPTFMGEDADAGFRKWVSTKIVYPPIAAENGIFGRVFYEFAIDKSGNVCDIKLLRGVDPLLDAEVLRVLKMSPKWTPGMQRGKAVKVRYQFPFMFQLQ
jgi:protein TonB